MAVSSVFTHVAVFHAEMGMFGRAYCCSPTRVGTAVIETTQPDFFGCRTGRVVSVSEDTDTVCEHDLHTPVGFDLLQLGRCVDQIRADASLGPTGPWSLGNVMW